MPVYPIINKNTGEQKEIALSIEGWEKFRIENEEWIRDWSDPSTAPNFGEVGEWKDKLVKSKPSWNEMLDRFSKVPGSNVKKI